MSSGVPLDSRDYRVSMNSTHSRPSTARSSNTSVRGSGNRGVPTKKRAIRQLTLVENPVRKQSSIDRPSSGLNMMALHLGEMVDIWTTGDGANTQHTILREMICARSPWFREQFNILEVGTRRSSQSQAQRLFSFLPPLPLFGGIPKVTEGHGVDNEDGGRPETPANLSINLPRVGRYAFSCFFSWLYDTSHLQLLAAADLYAGWEFDKATSWSFEFLLQLYLLGHNVGTPNFQYLVLEAIWLKVVNFEVPSVEEMHKIFGTYQRLDPLRNLLVIVKLEMWDLPLAPGRREADLNDTYPGAFISECLAKSMRQRKALECDSCGINGDREPCNSSEHTPDDVSDWQDLPWCSVHLHRTDEERASCEWRGRTLGERFENDN